VTDEQHDTLEAIRENTRYVRLGPTVAELAHIFGLTERAVKKRLQGLRKMNVLEYDALGRDIVK
jgi:Mn-dependent DtxR family transcriptional regulator